MEFAFQGTCHGKSAKKFIKVVLISNNNFINSFHKEWQSKEVWNYSR